MRDLDATLPYANAKTGYLLSDGRLRDWEGIVDVAIGPNRT